MVKVALSLGSNIGDRETHLNQSIDLFRTILREVKVSSFLNNKALLKPGAPLSWDMDYLNCVVVGDTDYGPYSLSQELKNIEKQVSGLQKRSWAPREIDIDILIYGNISINDSELVIPHRELFNRKFLLELLFEIAPDIRTSSAENILGALK